MRTIQSIYDKYELKRNLQDHQLRVAAVGSLIAQNLDLPVSQSDVILACLLHDMGNIIKFDLTYFPEFNEPEGTNYWEQVKARFIAKYGPDEHHATIEIARELGVRNDIVELLDGVGYTKLDRTEGNVSIEQKIVGYADMRVGPHGVLSIHERVEDGRKRYAGKKRPDMQLHTFEELFESLKNVEHQLFAHAKITPEEITNERIAPIVDELRKGSVEL